jgi:hypothetical protein
MSKYFEGESINQVFDSYCEYLAVTQDARFTLMVTHFLVVRAVEVLGLHFKMRIKGLLALGAFVRVRGLGKRNRKAP